MKAVLVDSSSAILLFKVGLLETLVQNYKIVMAKSVLSELTQKGYPGAEAFERFYKQGGIKVPTFKADGITLPDEKRISAMGQGERDTILLKLKHQGEFIILDDYKGARYCKTQHLWFINAILCIKVLYLGKKISESQYRDKIAEILGIGRYTKVIVDYALNCPSSDLKKFLP